MCAPEAFQSVPPYVFWCGPALRRAQHDHRPRWPVGHAARARLLTNLSDFCDAVFYRCGHRLVHAFVVGTFDKAGSPAVTPQKTRELLVRDARQQSGVIDLVSVQMKDGQDRTVSYRIQEFVD